jgi:hypothetical protein
MMENAVATEEAQLSNGIMYDALSLVISVS